MPKLKPSKLFHYLFCQALLATPLNYELFCVYKCVCVLTCCPLAVSLTVNWQCGHLAKHNSGNHDGSDDG